MLSQFTLLCGLSLISCEDVADKYKQDIFKPEKEEEKGYVADYDDGENIYINVKIAIDKKGWDSQSETFFKGKLKEQWEQINTRFNSFGQKGNEKLARNYIFQPDLEDIIVYEGCSYWGNNGADTKVVAAMNKNIFKLTVIYDFFYEGAENGEYGGGCGDYDGIGTILVINASDGAKDKYNDHFDQYTYRAITHELGHFRGVIDLYAEVINGANNQVNGQSFMPTSCLMNDMTYTPDSESKWSDYAVKIINKAGVAKVPGMINNYMYEDFADELIVEAKSGDQPVDAVIKMYPQSGSYGNGILSTPKREFTLSSGSKTLHARSVFFNNPDYKWDRTGIFLVEATYNGVKKYEWLTDYMLHDSGMNNQKKYTLSIVF